MKSLIVFNSGNIEEKWKEPVHFLYSNMGDIELI